jgi:hypothetical protein
MKCRYRDELFYEFHDEDVPEKCFLCTQNPDRLFVVRQIESMKMVHLCPQCMVNHCAEYMLDNTKSWEGVKGKSE